VTKRPKVYVAQVDTHYEILAVADTPARAKHEAALLAYRYLRDMRALTDETNTLAKIEEYFAINVTGIEIGTAQFKGDGL
jgi:hypothetical protein